MKETISNDQQILNATLHESDRYGNRDDAAGMATKLPMAIDRMHELGFCSSFLDYGTGKGKLLNYLKEHSNHPIQIDGYDPAVKQFGNKPNQKYDIVSCLDVLEHIELDTIDNVLSEIQRYTINFCYLIIDLQPAVKTLADGRNAHILLAPSDWWQAKVSRYFSSYSTFPIYHQSGDIQKVAFVASNNPKCLRAMHGFINKLNIFEIELKQGILDKKYKYQSQIKK